MWEFFIEFLVMGCCDLFEFKKVVDEVFKGFMWIYGEVFENFFDFFLKFFVGFEKLLLVIFWFLILIFVGGFVWFGLWLWKIIIFLVLVFVVIGILDMWEEIMVMFVIILVVMLLCIVIGILIGILMLCLNCVQVIVMLIFDIM